MPSALPGGSSFFLGQISLFSADFAPEGWAFANGQLIPVNQYSALFAILGNRYGGDERNFALPACAGESPSAQAPALA